MADDKRISDNTFLGLILSLMGVIFTTLIVFDKEHYGLPKLFGKLFGNKEVDERNFEREKTEEKEPVAEKEKPKRTDGYDLDPEKYITPEEARALVASGSLEKLQAEIFNLNSDILRKRQLISLIPVKNPFIDSDIDERQIKRFVLKLEEILLTNAGTVLHLMKAISHAPRFEVIDNPSELRNTSVEGGIFGNNYRGERSLRVIWDSTASYDIPTESLERSTILRCITRLQNKMKGYEPPPKEGFEELARNISAADAQLSILTLINEVESPGIQTGPGAEVEGAKASEPKIPELQKGVGR